MKNKKLKYILIPIVIIIWGLIFYKVFSYTSDDEFVFIDTNQQIIKDDVESFKDTFSLSLNYSDPFLKKNRSIRTELANTLSNGGNEAQNQIVNRNNARRQRQKQQVKPQFKPTKVEYGGKITNVKSDIKTAVVKIENKNKLLSDGDIVGNIEIIKIYNDSITIIDQGQKRSILKK